MPRNVEVKARVHDVEKLLKRSSEICNSNGTVIQQVDTFFNVNQGRLKLRVFKVSLSLFTYAKLCVQLCLKEGTGELIYYDRPDESGPKLSDYCKTTIPSPEELKLVLSSSLGVKGTVEKVRTLFLYGQTRIHVDQVANLGDFMELEVVQVVAVY